MNNSKNLIKEIKDFPTPGVKFKDLSLLFQHELYEMSFLLHELFRDTLYDYVAGIDARGFIIASALSMQAGKKFLPIRKKGKLPGPKVSYQGSCEYSNIELEMNLSSNDPFYRKENNNVLIIDDVLATGGTFKAAHELCERAGYSVKGFGAIVDLRYLNQFEINGMRCRSLVQYD